MIFSDETYYVRGSYYVYHWNMYLTDTLTSILWAIRREEGRTRDAVEIVANNDDNNHYNYYRKVITNKNYITMIVI